MSVNEKIISIKKELAGTADQLSSARKAENINDPIDTYIMDHIAIFWSKLFIKLGIIPNVVTMLAMICGVCGAVLLALPDLGLNILGLVLLFHNALFDACDGQVARLTKKYSQLGRMLDGLSDGTVYAALFVAGIVRAWNAGPFGSEVVWRAILIGGAALAYYLYIVQSQLPDYFKNLHMFMIDNSHGNELSRVKHIKKALDSAPPKSFEKFSQYCYFNYTSMQERRAPKAQKMLDLIEVYGKSDEVRAAFAAKSRKLVMLTNLMTFNLRTIVLIISYFCHVELAGILFDILILEPIRLVLLKKYENLCEEVTPLIQ